MGEKKQEQDFLSNLKHQNYDFYSRVVSDFSKIYELNKDQTAVLNKILIGLIDNQDLNEIKRILNKTGCESISKLYALFIRYFVYKHYKEIERVSL